MAGQKPAGTAGVSVEKGERQTAIDVSIVVEYGVSIVEVSDSIREAIIAGVEFATGLEVVSVDVTVSDVHLPGDDEETNADGSPAVKGTTDLQ